MFGTFIKKEFRFRERRDKYCQWAMIEKKKGKIKT